MEAAKGDNWLIRSLVFLELLSFPCSAHGIKCTVTQSGGATKYSVSEFNATGCKYSWTNSSDHVLANDMSEVGNLVLINTNHNIIIKQCVKEIVYVRSCTSEGIKMEALCTTSCSENAENQGWKGTTRNHWHIFTSVGILAILLTVFLCFKYGCRKCQRLTSKTQNPQPNVADEEGQSG